MREVLMGNYMIQIVNYVILNRTGTVVTYIVHGYGCLVTVITIMARLPPRVTEDMQYLPNTQAIADIRQSKPLLYSVCPLLYHQTTFDLLPDDNICI